MIELRNLVKVFNPGTVNEHVAIDHLNLTLHEGDFITIIGSNGAGKSTLINLIAGTLDVDEGLILLNDTDVSTLKEHKRAPYFGRVFQDPMMGTASDMTVLENLALARGRGKMRSLFRWSISKKDKEFFLTQLRSLGLGLEDKIYQKVGSLSGGQRQALTLLMATINQKPSHQAIRRDYVRFNPHRRLEAKKEVEEAYKNAKANYQKELSKIRNDKNINSEDKRFRLKLAYETFDEQVRKYDVTKPVLLLDEHTAALDPKTASKVLELTEKIVNQNHLTTIMITHNMNDAIRYGNRLIMMSKGKIVVDISKEEKANLTIEHLLKLFNDASEDTLSDTAILG